MITQPYPNAKAPLEIHSIDELKPGDVVLLKKSILGGAAQHFIEQVQRYSNCPHGHDDTTHAVICVDQCSTRGPMIVHVTESRGVSGSYIKEPFKGFLAREGTDRSFYVFRHQDAKVTQTLAAHAWPDDPEAKHHCRWRPWSAARAWLSRSNSAKPALEKTDISKDSICSQFVAEMVNAALEMCYSQADTEISQLPNVRLTPKALEHYLRLNHHFEVMVYQAKADHAFFYLACQTELKLARLQRQRSFQGFSAKSVQPIQKLQALIRGQRPSLSEPDQLDMTAFALTHMETALPSNCRTFHLRYNPEDAIQYRRRLILLSAVKKSHRLSQYFQKHTAEP